jgi:hypothetical protein
VTSPPTPDWRELVAVVLLSVTAILTAWTGFQASKWGGAMAIAFSQASAARMEAARSEGDANRRATIQVALFTQWLQAEQTGNEEVAETLAERFPEPLDAAFEAWLVTDPLDDPSAPASPFEMEEYAIPELADAAAADELADQKADEALRNNQRGDNYTILTVAFATVLFFTALSGKMRSSRAQLALLGLALVGFVGTVTVLLFYPVLV